MVPTPKPKWIRWFRRARMRAAQASDGRFHRPARRAAPADCRASTRFRPARDAGFSDGGACRAGPAPSETDRDLYIEQTNPADATQHHCSGNFLRTVQYFPCLGGADGHGLPIGFMLSAAGGLDAILWALRQPWRMSSGSLSPWPHRAYGPEPGTPALNLNPEILSFRQGLSAVHDDRCR